MPLELLIEIAGWIGAACVLGAYVLLSMGKLAATSPLFHLMNAVGAAGFIINTGWHEAIPSMVLNIIWLGVAAASLVRILMANDK